MRVDEFDFELPKERIALRPAEPRGSARLLDIHPNQDQTFRDLHISDLTNLLNAGDALVFNDTRVIPARLTGRRIGRGDMTPRVELTLLRQVKSSRWTAFAKPARKLEPGDRICFGQSNNACLAGELHAEIIEKSENGEIVLQFDFCGPVFDEILAEVGRMPLPPYIASRRDPDAQDQVDYQTIYANQSGAVAAPTAGLHFTQHLFEALKLKGIEQIFVTLHVGAGTFLPVKSKDTEQHKMHAEWGQLNEETADRLNQIQSAGGKIIAVGTTSLRLLESAADENGRIKPYCGETDIFITPGYRFKAVDMLLTNFHLPRSTLFMLVCAFSGLDVMKRAYEHAIQSGYRFYSYGDACFLRQAKLGE